MMAFFVLYLNRVIKIIAEREFVMSKKVPQEEIVMNLFSTRYLDSVRKKTEEIAKQMGFDEEQIFDLALVVDEAYVNAIEHGAEGRTDTELEIKYLVFDDKLEISIKDCGRGFDMNKISVPNNLKSISSTRGRGLGLMKLLTDEFFMESKPGVGTTIKFSKYL